MVKSEELGLMARFGAWRLGSGKASAFAGLQRDEEGRLIFGRLAMVRRVVFDKMARLKGLER